MPGSVIWLMKVKVNIIPPDETPPGNGGLDPNLLWLIAILSIVGIAAILAVWFWVRKSKKKQRINEQT